MDDFVFLNGDFVKSGEAKISVFDRGFIFGDGIYEVVPVVGGKLVDKDDFWIRFEASLEAICLKLPYKIDDFEEILNKIIIKNKLNEGGVYIQITRGVAPRSFAFIENLEPTCFIFTYEADIINNPLAKIGIDVVSVDDIRWKRRDIKSISLLAQCYAKTQAIKNGAYEGFMVENGFVTEGTSSSIFIIKDGVLITKPLSNEILPGIRRKVILDFCTELGLEVEQRKFSMKEVYDASEVFISAATLPILPVVKADGISINGGKIGENFIALRQKYVQRLIAQAECVSS